VWGRRYSGRGREGGVTSRLLGLLGLLRYQQLGRVEEAFEEHVAEAQLQRDAVAAEFLEQRDTGGVSRDLLRVQPTQVLLLLLLQLSLLLLLLLLLLSLVSFWITKSCPNLTDPSGSLHLNPLPPLSSSHLPNAPSSSCASAGLHPDPAAEFPEPHST
jgi:hypothetical protein